MSGHSKWHSIKHQKAATDAKRGQMFTKLTREIIVAARNGGSSIDANYALRLAVQRAKDSSMPWDNINRAIQKASGGGEGDGGGFGGDESDASLVEASGAGPDVEAEVDVPA